MSEIAVLSPQELQQLNKDFAIIVVKELTGSLNLRFWEELLDANGVAEDWKLDVATIRLCTRRKKNPLPLGSKGDRITRREAREWRQRYYKDYASKHSG